MSEKRGVHTAPTPLATGRKLGLFSGSIRPSFVLSHNMPIINATDKLASFWRFSVTPSSISSHSLATDYWPLILAIDYWPLTTVLPPHAPRLPHAPRPTLHGRPAGVKSCADPPPLATACHRPLNCQKPNGPDLDEHPLYSSMSPNQTIFTDKIICSSPLAAAHPLTVLSWPEALHASGSRRACLMHISRNACSLVALPRFPGIRPSS